MEQILEKTFVNLLENQEYDKFWDKLQLETKTNISMTDAFEKVCHTTNCGEIIKLFPHKYEALKRLSLLDSTPPTFGDLLLTKTRCNHFPIHCAALSLDAGNLKAILEFNRELVNQTESNRFTALHIVLEAFNGENLESVMKAIEVLLEFGADFFAPSLLKSDTPFSVLIRKLQLISRNEERMKVLDFMNDKKLFASIYVPRKVPQLALKNFHLALWQQLTVSTDWIIEWKDKTIEEKTTMLTDLMVNDDERMIRTVYLFCKDPEKFDDIRNIIGELLKNARLNGLEFNTQAILDLMDSIAGDIRNKIPECFQTGSSHDLKELLNYLNQRNYEGLPEDFLANTVDETTPKDNIDVFMEHPTFNVHALDTHERQALYYAIDCENKIVIQKLLAAGASLCDGRVCEVIPKLDPQLLEDHFDDCLTIVSRNGIYFDVTCNFQSIKTLCDTKSDLDGIIRIAYNQKLQHLVQHPLITSFLSLKWQLFSPIAYTEFLVYFIIFAMMLVHNIFLFRPDKDGESEFYWVPLITSLVVVSHEFFWLGILHIYSISLKSIIKLCLIGSTGLMFCDDECVDLEINRRAISALAVLLAAIELIIYLGDLPILSLTIYMSILKKVTSTFVRVFALYSVILLGFAGSFYTLVGGLDSNGTTTLSSVGHVLLKTVVMFSGEVDTEYFNSDSTHWMGYLIIVGFIFFMCIILMNLLGALAVSDTQKIKEDVTFLEWIKRTTSIFGFERVYKDYNIFSFMKCTIVKQFHFKFDYLTKTSSHFTKWIENEPVSCIGKLSYWLITKSFVFDKKIIKSIVTKKLQRLDKQKTEDANNVQQMVKDLLKKYENTESQNYEREENVLSELRENATKEQQILDDLQENSEREKQSLNELKENVNKLMEFFKIDK